MDDKKYLPIKMLHLVLMFGALVGCCYELYYGYSIAGFRLLTTIVDVLPIVAIIFGLYYFFNGYKKNAAVYYKLFMAFFILDFGFSMFYGMINSLYDMYSAILDLVCFTCIVLLYCGKDLGKTKSSALAIIIVATRIIKLVISLTVYSKATIDMFSIMGLFTLMIKSITNVLLAGSAGLMVYGKYKDKEARGAK